MRIDAPAITGSFTLGTVTLPDGSALATTGSNTFTGNQTINGTIVATGTTLVSSSVQVDVMSATNIARLATTGSNTLQGTQTINGSLVVTGSLTAQQFIVSSSVTYLTESFASGSHKFGDSSDDTHQFTGSILLTGSIGINTPANSLFGLTIKRTAGSNGALYLVGNDNIVGNSGINFYNDNTTSGSYISMYTTGGLNLNGSLTIANTGNITTTGTINGLSIPNDLFAQQFLLMGA